MTSPDDTRDQRDDRRVVITGIGAVSPLGVGARTTFARWVEGESGIEDGLARCDEFEATDFLSKKEVRRADRFTHLSIAAAEEGSPRLALQTGRGSRSRACRLHLRHRASWRATPAA